MPKEIEGSRLQLWKIECRVAFKRLAILLFGHAKEATEASCLCAVQSSAKVLTNLEKMLCRLRYSPQMGFSSVLCVL